MATRRAVEAASGRVFSRDDLASLVATKDITRSGVFVIGRASTA